MDIKHLNAFLAVCEYQNFTKAAEKLCYAQSNVTTQIKQLETELDIQLFNRIGKSVTLTPEGEQLYPYAVKILTLSKDITDLYSGSLDHGKIIIGSSESLAIYKLPPIIQKYRELHPNVEIYLKILDTEDFVPMLNNNTVDLAFAMENPIEDKSIVTLYKHKEEISIMSKDSSLCNRKNLTAEDFRNIPLVLTNPACCYRSFFEKDLLSHNIIPKIVLATGSIPLLKESVLCGLGTCVLPRFVAEKELLSGELQVVPYSVDFPIYSQLIHHKDKWLSPSIQAFIQLFLDSF